VKALADALGARRDRDVAIGFLEGLAAEVGPDDREALAPLLARLREEQAGANESLALAVAGQRLKKLRRRLGKLVEAAGK
jgi:hypothetical protein